MERLVYSSVSCSFYDHIESFAVKKETVEIIYSDDFEKKVNGIIVDLFSKNKTEFWEIIRMDLILSINEIPKN